MTRGALGLAGQVAPPVYAVMTPLILLSQHLAVALCYHWAGARLELDAGFWLLPLRRLADMPGLTSAMAASVFLIGFLVAWALAVLSFRRATWSNRGYWLSLFAIFPVLPWRCWPSFRVTRLPQKTWSPGRSIWSTCCKASSRSSA